MRNKRHMGLIAIITLLILASAACQQASVQSVREKRDHGGAEKPAHKRAPRHEEAAAA